jgi:uncharacterized protein (DUF488 family)
MKLWTVGHGTRPLADLIGLLQSASIVHLVDVRTIPRSRFNPQFNRETLAAALPATGILYTHVPGLGGLRRPRRDSANTAWRNDGFRGYADHMQTEEFRSTLGWLLELAAGGPTAVMCAEREPGRCHRSLIADAVLARGAPVEHLLEPGRSAPHALTPWARIEDGQVSYPGVAGTPDLFADTEDAGS